MKHDVGIDVHQQHAEGYRGQKQGLEFVPDSQIEEKARNRYHQIVSPGQIEERCLMDKVIQRRTYIFHLLTSCCL